MWIIGCDFLGRYQQVAAMNEETGEVIERRLSHETKEAETFYESLPRGACIGMEASCTAQWFERLMDRCGHRLQVGDPATIRASVVRKQKTDARDAQQLLELLLTNRFPSIWIPTPAERDSRQLLVHRHKLVSWRTQVRNQLSALARSQGIFPRTRFWTQSGRQKLESLSLDRWAARRRQDLLRLLDGLDEQIAELTRQIEQQARARNDAVELMQQDGVGPIVSLAFVLTLGTAKRFRRGKQVASYLGLNPRERSSGGTQRFGHISKQAGQPHDALVAGRSGLDSRAERSGTATGLSAVGFPPRTQDRRRGGGQEVGGEVVLAVAGLRSKKRPRSRWLRCRAARAKTGAPIDSVIGHPASLRS